MNRTYELMFIVRPDMTEEDQDKLISTLETAVTSSGGQVKNVEKMGKRRLAYTVRKFHDGLYMLLSFEGSGGLVHELERRLRVTEPVIKFLSVRIDEEQKRLDKIKAIRDARRKAAPAPAPAPVTPEPAGETPAVTAEKAVRRPRPALHAGVKSRATRDVWRAW
jgi:small subunit ribosomal protein S6